MSPVHTFLLCIPGIVFLLAYLRVRYSKKYLAREHDLQKEENRKRQEILKAVIHTQEEERLRIASNIHDSVGSELSALKLNLSRHVRLLDENSPKMEEFRKDLQSLDAAIDAVKNACRDLYPVALQNHGFITTLEIQIEKVRQAGGFFCSFHHALNEAQIATSYEKKLSLFRICQEVLNNILKYAECKHLFVHLYMQNRVLFLRFKHDGVSFTNKDAENSILHNKGIGLKSIFYRVGLVNGHIDYRRQEKDSYIHIEFPVEHGED